MVTTSFPRFQGDLPGRFILDLLIHLKERNHSAIVICPCYRGEEGERQMEGIEVIRAGSNLPSFLKLSPDSSLISQYRSGHRGMLRILIYAVLQLYHCVTKGHDRQIDLINSHWLVPSALSGAISSSLLGKPHVVTTHGSGVAALESVPFGPAMLRFITRHCDTCTSVSHYLGRRLFRVLAWSSPERPAIVRIPMGSDEDSFHPQPESPISSGPKLLFVGRLEEGKGADCLLEAASMLLGDFPDITVRVVGNGPMGPELERRSRQLGIGEHVKFAGFLPNSRLPCEYAGCHVVVVPSIVDGGVAEGLGLVAIEAGLSGRPVIASEIGGIPEVVQDGNSGLLVPEKDPERMALAIRVLLRDPEMRKRLSRRARKHSLRFSHAEVTEDFDSLLRRTLGKLEAPVAGI